MLLIFQTNIAMQSSTPAKSKPKAPKTTAKGAQPKVVPPRKEAAKQLSQSSKQGAKKIKKEKRVTVGWFIEAVKENIPNTVSQYISERGNVNIEMFDGSTPLLIAVNKQYKPICEMLLTAGADANAKHKDGTTALMLAAQKGYTEICKLLIDSGALLNEHNKNKRTALLCAAHTEANASLANKARVYEMLIDHKAQIHLKDSNGQTALQVAFHNGLHQELLKNRVKALLVSLRHLRDNKDEGARLLYRHFSVFLLPALKDNNLQEKAAAIGAFKG